jgi:flagellin
MPGQEEQDDAGHYQQQTSASLQASESRIRDANVAEVVAELTKNQILGQSGLAALSYAPVSSESILRFLA